MCYDPNIFIAEETEFKSQHLFQALGEWAMLIVYIQKTYFYMMIFICGSVRSRNNMECMLEEEMVI